jgi:hypothetical protein
LGYGRRPSFVAVLVSDIIIGISMTLKGTYFYIVDCGIRMMETKIF